MAAEIIEISDSDSDIETIPYSSQPYSTVVNDSDSEDIVPPDVLFKQVFLGGTTKNAPRKSTILDALDALSDSVPSSPQSTPVKSQKSVSSSKRKLSYTDLDDDGDSDVPKKKRAPRKTHTSKEDKEAEKLAKKREKENEKAAAKERKEAEKAAKKQMAGANKLVRGKQHLVKDFTLHVSTSLRETPLVVAVARRLAEHDCSVTYFESGSIRNLIRWEREVDKRYNEMDKEWTPVDVYRRFEAVCMIYVQAEALLRRGLDGIGGLKDSIKALRQEYALTDKHQIFIMIDDMEAHYRKTGKGSRAASAAARQNGQLLVNKRDVERALASLQVSEKCFIVHVEGDADAAEWIYNMTADMGVKPHKLIDRSHLPFCSITSVEKGSDNSDTYSKMLQQLKMVSEPRAQAVMSLKPTLRSLFEAYEALGDPNERAKVLKDVVVKRNEDGTKCGKILNIALSSKVAVAFWNEDALTTLP